MFNNLLKRGRRRVSLTLNDIYFNLFQSKLQCNICNYKCNQFVNDNWHQFSRCPKCGSDVRRRLLWATLVKEKGNWLNTYILNKDVIHFAPETTVKKLILPFCKSYTTADFFAEGYSYSNIDMKLDISSMDTLTDNSFDTLIALDVLEHVYDDKKAIREIWRILRSGGACILTVPQKDELEKTFEDHAITDPKEREDKFGQFDHLRIYGTDFYDMLNSAGFEVHIIDDNNFNIETANRNVLFPPIKSKHPLATNYRKIYIGVKK